MKILSVDVGIKNLGLCILETTNEGFNIIYWDSINLIEEKINMCNCKINNKKSCKPCNKQAVFFKNNNFFCKSHANASNYQLPTSNLTKYKNLKLSELKTLCENYNIISDENTKNSKIKAIESFIDNNVLQNINILNTKSINLIDIGIGIKNNLDKLDIFILKDIDYVLIENQISPIANRMNCIQGMIAQYFLMKNMEKILFISAANKLKLFIGNKKTTYSERKKISVKLTKELLIKNICNNNQKEKIIDLFNRSKKRDDLADCFLQGLWYLAENNDIIKNIVVKINDMKIIN